METDQYREPAVLAEDGHVSRERPRGDRDSSERGADVNKAIEVRMDGSHVRSNGRPRGDRDLTSGAWSGCEPDE